ncbi:MAG: hypothetical protein ACT4QA_19920 [Panacagrimonas sp.]
MEFEIHMYLAVGKAADGAAYPRDELHPMLIFLRQPTGSEHDLSVAESVALASGWTELDFTKAGTLPDDAQDQMEESFRACYRAAAEMGEAIMVYPAAVRPAKGKI